MQKLVAALVLVAVLTLPATGQLTFNVWERGYITCPVHSFIVGSDSVDITPPIIDSDTLNVRGFIIGIRGIASGVAGYGYGIRIRYRQAGNDGWYRWQQWLKYKNVNNLGMPLIGSYQPGTGTTHDMGMTDFMPLANVRLLRLINPSANASMQTVVIWFLDQQDAKAADWTTWTMP